MKYILELLGLAVAAWVIWGLCAALGRRYLRRTPRLNNALVNVGLSLCSVWTILLIFEAFFSVFMVQSDNWGFTLSCREWLARYAVPRNSMGYRDDERTAQSLQGRRVAIVTGDSLMLGWGIKDYRNRFSNVLERELGPRWTVANVAQGGWDTPKELEAVRTYPLKPELVIVGYFHNDIEHALKASGKPFMPIPPAPAFLAPLLDRSLLADFLYWKAYRRLMLMGAAQSFWDNLEGGYTDDTIWAKHRKALEQFVDYTRTQHIRLLVLVLFNPYDVARSDRINQSRVFPLFKELGVDYVDAAECVRGLTTREIVVNPYDGHYNERVNARIAATVANHLREGGLPEVAQ